MGTPRPSRGPSPTEEGARSARCAGRDPLPGTTGVTLDNSRGTEQHCDSQTPEHNCCLAEHAPPCAARGEGTSGQQRCPTSAESSQDAGQRWGREGSVAHSWRNTSPPGKGKLGIENSVDEAGGLSSEMSQAWRPKSKQMEFAEAETNEGCWGCWGVDWGDADGKKKENVRMCRDSASSCKRHQ